MSVPVSTGVEMTGAPSEYKSGEMNAMDGDGKRKVAFITGTTGQDGSYLVELLLSKGYIVHGIKRRSSSYNHPRLEHIMEEGYPNRQNFFLHYGDLTDLHALVAIIRDVRPTEVYNLAGGGATTHTLSVHSPNSSPRGYHVISPHSHEPAAAATF